MKLLTPKEIQEAKGQEVVRGILRASETQEVLKKTNSALAKSEAEFASTLQRQREVWALEQEEHRKEVVKRKEEINELEKKKLNALIPVEIFTTSAKEKLDKAEKYLAELNQREENMNDLTEKLENRLDAVGQRETDVSKKEQELKLSQEGLERQKESVVEGSKKLSKEMADFAEVKLKAEKDIDERKTALFLRDQELTNKANVLSRKERILNEMEVKLKDERGTLDRAWQEVNRKKLSP